MTCLLLLLLLSRCLQLPDVVLIKDEDSDSNDAFEEGEWERRAGFLNLWAGGPEWGRRTSHRWVDFDSLQTFVTHSNAGSGSVIQRQ